MGRDRWRNIHPSNCMCEQCRRERRDELDEHVAAEAGHRRRATLDENFAREAVRRRRWRFIGRFGRRAFQLALLVVAVVVAVAAALAVYHWNEGATVESALRLTIQDGRVAAACPTNDKVILDFVRRSALVPEVTEGLGEDWAKQVCDGALLATDGREDAPPPPQDIDALVATRVQATVEALQHSPSNAQGPASTVSSAPLASPTPGPDSTSAVRGLGSTLPSSPLAPPTPSPTSSRLEATSGAADVLLKEQLPRDVFEEFHDCFYGHCEEPPFDDLRVVDSWSGDSGGRIELTSTRGTYFLVVLGNPQDASWRFDSVLEHSRGRETQSLRIDSSVPEALMDAQEWCSIGTGVLVPDVLHINAASMSWAVFLVASAGTAEVPRAVAEALSGYYGICPPEPPIEQIQATRLGAGDSNISLEFVGQPPHYYLGVIFQPTDKDWSFSSVNVSGNWRAAGPAVSATTGEVIDFTATCPSSPGLHHLRVEADGGRWVVYLITSRPD